MVDNINTYITETNFPKNTTAITNAKLTTATTPLLSPTKLEGELELKNYPELENIDLPNQKLRKLTIINCPKLKDINVDQNSLVELDITRIKTNDDSDAGSPVLTTVLQKLVIKR